MLSHLLVLSEDDYFIDFFSERFEEITVVCHDVQTLIGRLIRSKYESQNGVCIFLDETVIGKQNHADLLERLYGLSHNVHFLACFKDFDEQRLVEYQSVTDNKITVFQHQAAPAELKQFIHHIIRFEHLEQAHLQKQRAILSELQQAQLLAELCNELFMLIKFDLTGKVIDMNEYATQTTGWHLSQLVGRPIHEVVLWPFTPDYATGEELEAFFGETRYFTAEGSQKWLVTQVKRVKNQTPGYYYLVAKDITEHKNQERIEQFGNYQEGMDKAKSELIHNFGNTLNSMLSTQDVLHKGVSQLQNISGYLRRWLNDDEGMKKDPQTFIAILEKGINQTLGSHFENTIDVLQNDLDVLVETINLDQSMLQTESSSDVVNLFNLVHEVIKSTQAMLNEAQVEIRVLDTNTSIFLMISRNQLFQTLLNLVKNAAEALSETQSYSRLITIQTVKVPNDGVSLTVHDNGKGIPESQLHDIFNYGFTTKQKGSGQGLHSVANFMNTFGGEVQVTSSPEKGTSFVLRFPQEMVKK